MSAVPARREDSRTLTDSVTTAIAATLAYYRPELDHDPNLRAVRVEVRLKPNGAVRNVVVQRESEFDPTRRQARVPSADLLASAP